LLPVNADVNILNTLSFRLDTTTGNVSAFNSADVERAIQNAVAAGLVRQDGRLPPLNVRVRAVHTDHDAGVVKVDYQVQPQLPSSACRADVASRLMDASQNMLSNSSDSEQFLNFVVADVEDQARAKRQQGGGGSDESVAVVKAISHVTHSKKSKHGSSGPELLVTPQLERQHVHVTGSFQTGPVNQVLLDTGVAQRALAKTLHGLPDPVKVSVLCRGKLGQVSSRYSRVFGFGQVAGTPSDVRITGYSVDKASGNVSFCYEARIEGRSEATAGQAAIAYARALGSGASSYAGVDGTEKRSAELANFNSRVQKHFVSCVEAEIQEQVNAGPQGHSAVQKLSGNAKVKDQLRQFAVRQVLPPVVTDGRGITAAQESVCWRNREGTAPDVAVNAVIELDGVSSEDLSADPVTRRAIEDSLAELGLIDDDVNAIGTRQFEVRIMNVSDVIGGSSTASRVGIQFQINGARCAELGGARNEKEAFTITSKLASQLKKRLAAATGDAKQAARLKKLFRGNVESLRSAKATAALLKANARKRGGDRASSWDEQTADAFPTRDVSFAFQSNDVEGPGVAERDEHEIANWYSGAHGSLAASSTDSNLSSEKLGALRATFRKYDISSSGRLGVQELMMVLHNLGYEGDHGETARAVISKHSEGDADHLDFQSFCRWKMEEEAANKAEQEKQQASIQGELILDSSFAFDESSSNSEENRMKKQAFQTALAEIPYDLGLKTTKENVSVKFSRQKDGTVKVCCAIFAEPAQLVSRSSSGFCL